MDPLRVAYQADLAVNDAVKIGLHYMLQHLIYTGTYAGILFVDFSSAFNTIIPGILSPKLCQLTVSSTICQSISCQTGNSRCGRGKQLLVYGQSALVPLKDVFSPDCSSLSTPRTSYHFPRLEVGVSGVISR